MDARDRIPNTAIALKRINPPTVFMMIAEPEHYTTWISSGAKASALQGLLHPINDVSPDDKTRLVAGLVRGF
jgi:hypothetical protein